MKIRKKLYLEALERKLKNTKQELNKNFVIKTKILELYKENNYNNKDLLLRKIKALVNELQKGVKMDLDDEELEATKKMFYKDKHKIIKVPTKIKRYKEIDIDDLIKIIIRQNKEIEELKKENNEIWGHLPRLDQKGVLNEDYLYYYWYYYWYYYR